MVLRGLVIAGTIAAAGLFAAQEASALTYTVLEKGGPSTPNPDAPASPDAVFNDFPTNPSTYSFDLGALGADAISFYGGVAHASGSASNYVDAWTVDFGPGSYNLVFDWKKVSGNFDGSFLDITAGLPGTVLKAFSGTGSSWVAVVTGVVKFSVNPILPNSSSGAEKGYWAVHATAVPVPAALPLLVGGLGVLGFAGWRRRKSAS